MTRSHYSFWLGTSWKMNGSKSMAKRYAETLSRSDWRRFPHVTPFVLPPFPFVEEVAERLAGTPVRVGVQNVHWKQEGAFTGEVSPRMAAEMGATLAEIGHSERRTLFGETDEMVRAKTQAVLAANLTPVVCLGDSRLENDAGVAAVTVIRQAKIALSGLTLEEVARCVLAYEPVWSIGVGGTPADPAAVSVTLAELRGALIAAYGDAGSAIRLLYGGSVSIDNVELLAATPNVGGLFVGRAAWTPEGLLELIVKANELHAVKVSA